VVIATVFLTIIGMSAGIALASWHNARVQANQSQGGGTTSGGSTSGGSTVPDARPCRPETQQIAPGYGARGTLTIQLLLRTTSGTAIWICKDEAGRLFYHANRGGETAKWIEGETALFLPGVQPDEEGGYEVTAGDGTTFSVNSSRLYIVHKNGRTETQPAA